jgi:hypothetical protein
MHPYRPEAVAAGSALRVCLPGAVEFEAALALQRALAYEGL